MWIALTRSLPRVSNFIFPRSLIRNYQTVWRTWLFIALTLSLPRVTKFKFPLHPHQKYYITQYEERGISWLTQMKVAYTINFSLRHLCTLPLRDWENVLFELGSERVNTQMEDDYTTNRYHYLTNGWEEVPFEFGYERVNRKEGAMQIAETKLSSPSLSLQYVVWLVRTWWVSTQEYLPS